MNNRIDKKKVVSYVTEEFVAEAKKRNLPSPEKYLVVDVVKISMGLGVCPFEREINEELKE